MSDDEKRITPQQSFEIRNEVIEKLMAQLAHQIGVALPDDWAFSLFLYQLHDEQEETNLFYVSSLSTGDAIPLIKLWVNKHTQ